MLDEFAKTLGDSGTALQWLKNHPEHINDLGGDGLAPIHLAIVASHLRVAEAIVLAGALVNIETRDGHGNTPLHLLALSKAESARPLASLLIDFGAELIARNRELQTPLHLAVMAGGKSFAALLIEAGADPLLRDRSGQSALDLAGDDDEMKKILRAALKR